MYKAQKKPVVTPIMLYLVPTIPLGTYLPTIPMVYISSVYYVHTYIQWATGKYHPPLGYFFLARLVLGVGHFK